RRRLPLSRRAASRRADPAGFCDVEHDVVLAPVLPLYVGVTPVAHPESLVDIITTPGASRRELLTNRFRAFGLKADVVNAAVGFAPLDARGDVVLEIEDRQVDVAVTQEHPTGPRIVDLANLLHAEHFDVELCRLPHILGREGDVLDLRHGYCPIPRLRGYDRALVAGSFDHLIRPCVATYSWPSPNTRCPSASRVSSG